MQMSRLISICVTIILSLAAVCLLEQLKYDRPGIYLACLIGWFMGLYCARKNE
jgi:hypothetical protein